MAFGAGWEAGAFVSVVVVAGAGAEAVVRSSVPTCVAPLRYVVASVAGIVRSANATTTSAARQDAATIRVRRVKLLMPFVRNCFQMLPSAPRRIGISMYR